MERLNAAAWMPEGCEKTGAEAIAGRPAELACPGVGAEKKTLAAVAAPL